MHIRHNPEEKRFIAGKGVGQGFLGYEILDDGSLDLRHTFVDEPHRGKGIATVLAHCALGHAIATDRKVVTTCPFVAQVMDSEPAFSSLRAGQVEERVEPRRAEHLQYAIESPWG